MRMFSQFLRTAVLAVCWLMLGGQVGHAEIKSFGPFTVDTNQPDIIKLSGPIDDRAALAFRRALMAAPQVKLIALNSPGGSVDDGLLISDDVFQRKLTTFVPPDAECYSACAYIYFAGAERRVEGKLGVHQISSNRPDLTSAQFSISDIIEMMNRYAMPMDVLTIMFRTPSEDMYVFSQEEIAKYAINRSSAPALSEAASAPVADPATPALTDEPAPSEQAAASPQPDPAALAPLSVLEDYAKRTNRMVLYSGLDFAERDIASASVDDARACAIQCLSMAGSCRAFTFNVATAKSRGPNCFLKNGRGQLDGNATALSGQLLSAADASPRAHTVGVIDPESSLFENVDLTGSDLSRRPFSQARTPRECRLACVGNDQCQAFTFVKRKKECWLKSSSGTPRAAADMVSGLKKLERFEPSVVDLE